MTTKVSGLEVSSDSSRTGGALVPSGAPDSTDELQAAISVRGAEVTLGTGAFPLQGTLEVTTAVVLTTGGEPPSQARPSEPSPTPARGDFLGLFTREERARIGHSLEVLDGEYAQEEIRSIDRPRILDIGGNVGSFAVWASRYWRDPELLSYEPNPQVFGHLQQNMKAFGVRGTAVMAGISDRDGKAALWDMGTGPSGFSTTLQSARRRAVGEIQLVDSRNLPPCDILKCDAEGAECFLLRHYRHWSGVQAVLYEWHTVPNREFGEYVFLREGFRCLRGEKFEGAMDPYFPITFGVQVWMRPARS